MGNEFGLKGFDEALKKLKTLAPKMQKKALNAAVRKGANVFRDAARENARKLDDPATATNISKAIATAYSGRESKKVGGSVMRVGVQGGAKQYVKGSKRGKGSYQTGGAHYYWRFLEFGTEKMAAQPFMRPAMDPNIDKATGVIAEQLDKSISKIIAQGAA